MQAAKWKEKQKFETDLHHLQSLMGVRGTKVFFWCYLFVKILWLVEIYLQGNVVFHQPGILPSAYFPWVIRNEMMSKMICLWLTSPSAGLAQNLVCYETQHVTFSPPSPLYAVFIFHWKRQSPAVTVNTTLALTLIHTGQPCMCMLPCILCAIY